MIRIDSDLLFPGRGEPIADGTVLIDGGNITYAGPRTTVPSGSPADATHVPAVMPGMWECHGHFTGMAIPNIETELTDGIVERAARATADLKRTLDGGVTSVREVGGLGISLRVAIEEGSIVGPTLYPAGQVLSTTGGHADVHGLPLDWMLEASADGKTIGALADGVPECLRAVRHQLRRGADVIKICASGGVMSEIDHPMHQQFSDEELRAIVEEAARAERIVAAHCHGKAGIMAALRAGAGTIEHGSYLDDEAAARMLDQGAILVPTRAIIAILLEMEEVLPAYAYRKVLMVADHHELAMKTAVAAGVKIAMGNDIFTSGEHHGRNGREVRFLIEAGMTPLEAIEAATANGPETLGPQAPASGQLREGYDADLIAFDSDPTSDLSVWGDPTRITHVWKAGTSVKAPS
jgi:imidazolonepropionase-like amidohydrolase